jgi:hypothetical protein
VQQQLHPKTNQEGKEPAMPKQLPPDPEEMNDDRAEWAAAALRDFQCTTGTDYGDALADLLCDLAHWCDRNDIDFEASMSIARMHYEAETEGGGDTLRFAVPDLLEVLEAQTDAAQAVIDAWENGDLAGAVRTLDGSILSARAAIAKAKGGAS